MLYAFAVATVLITLAELGDKTQLLTLGLACRYKTWQVLTGVFAAVLALQLIATLVGQLIGGVLPGSWLAVITGLLFIGFGVWTLRSGMAEDDAEEVASGAAGLGPILTVAVAFFLAELGDKTQIMTMTLAADPGAVLRAFGALGPAISDTLSSLGVRSAEAGTAATFWGVWLGATLGMLIADGAAIVVGTLLGKRLPGRLITRVSGAIFIAFGLLTLASTLLR